MKGKGKMVTHFLLNGPMVEDSGEYEEEEGLIDDLPAESVTINPDKGQTSDAKGAAEKDQKEETAQSGTPATTSYTNGVETRPMNKAGQSPLCQIL